MSDPITKLKIPSDLPANGEIAIGTVQEISADGIARVLVDGDSEARCAHSVLSFESEGAARAALSDRRVLVVTRQASTPVIVGVVREQLWKSGNQDESDEIEARLPGDSAVSLKADERRIDLSADTEIRLTCGKSVLVLRRDGTVIIRGVKVVSRASQSNKIRGASVNIN